MERSWGLETSDDREERRAPFRVAVDSRWLDSVHNFWTGTKEVLSGMAMLWLEPIMESNSLIELSIVLLLMERVIESIAWLDPKLLAMESVSTNASPFPSEGYTDSDSWFHGVGVLLGSPLIAILVGFALLLSCLANASYDTRMFAPGSWLLRSFLVIPRHESLVSSEEASPGLLYSLLLLFYLEGILLLSITMTSCHAITFPEWIEEDVNILTSLMGVWLLSLLASSSVRCCLYYSIGD